MLVWRCMLSFSYFNKNSTNVLETFCQLFAKASRSLKPKRKVMFRENMKKSSFFFNAIPNLAVLLTIEPSTNLLTVTEVASTQAMYPITMQPSSWKSKRKIKTTKYWLKTLTKNVGVLFCVVHWEEILKGKFHNVFKYLFRYCHQYLFIGADASNNAFVLFVVCLITKFNLPLSKGFLIYISISLLP